MAEVLAALRCVHNMGFLYCDLKPENILLTDKFHAKLGDFGAARPYTETGQKIWKEAAKSLSSLRDGDWRVKKGIAPAVSEWLGSRNIDLEQKNYHEADERMQVKSLSDFLLTYITASEKDL